MNTIIERFDKIKLNIISAKPAQKVNIIAVSKTFPLDHVYPLINHGHHHFGENKVQEAISKWSKLKTENENIKLLSWSKDNFQCSKNEILYSGKS